jgi:enamine deaminase RidA (YjgF/YER057c/UK114 family)
MRLLALLAAVLGAVSITSCQSKEIIGANPGGTAPFSPTVKAGGFVYTSAVSGAAGGKGDIKAQTKAALDALSAKLKAAGSSLENACLITVYLRNASDFAGMGSVYSTYFPKDPPARVTVMVDGIPDPDALVEISSIAVPDGAGRRTLKPAGWSNSPLPYSYGVQSGDTVFLAGLISRNGVNNTNVKGDVTAQTNYIMGNAAAILKEADMTLNDVAQSRVYITDTANFPAMNAAYRAAFTDAPPARATVKTGLTGPDFLVEIAMIAVKDPSRTAINPPGPDGKPGAVSPNYSTAIRVGSRLFVAGLSGETDADKGNAGAQTTEAIARVERAMKAAGFGLEDAVEGVAYVVDPAKFPEVDTAYRDAFHKDFPAGTSVGVGLVVPGAEGEFSIIAQK